MLETSKFKIGLCQLSVTSDKNTNLEKARSSIELGSRQGANLVVLPEMWNCPCSTDVFAQFAEDFDDKDSALSFKMLSEVACKEGITIVGGSIPEWSGGELYNTCCVFAPNGELLAKHRKLHLFDVDIPGDVSFHESNTFSAGARPTIVDTDVGRIGIGICHDIRFPELAMVYKDRGAHLICYPGAFNVSTGEALWEIEQRARQVCRRNFHTIARKNGEMNLYGSKLENFRAVDNQLFVATCSPSRDSAGSYAIWGHSSVVSPLGEVVATSGHHEAIVIAEVDFSQVQITRESLPILKQRRESVYQLIDLNH